jgi:hypothetical protein
MKKYSFLIINLFFLSTPVYAHGIEYEFDDLDIAIVQSKDPVGFIQNHIQYYENLVSFMLTHGPSQWILASGLESILLEQSQSMLQRLYNELYDLTYEPLEDL